MTKSECRKNNETTMTKPGPSRTFDLEERTARFGEAIIAFAKEVPDTPVTRPLVSQLVRAGTSVGANYCEADNAESKKDFRHRINTCRKEARETRHWLRMLMVAQRNLEPAARSLWREAKELNLIFSSIFRKTG